MHITLAVVTESEVLTGMALLKMLGHTDSTPGEIAAAIRLGTPSHEVLDTLLRLEGTAVRYSDLLGGWELI